MYMSTSNLLLTSRKIVFRISLFDVPQRDILFEAPQLYTPVSWYEGLASDRTCLLAGPVVTVDILSLIRSPVSNHVCFQFRNVYLSGTPLAPHTISATLSFSVVLVAVMVMTGGSEA